MMKLKCCIRVCHRILITVNKLVLVNRQIPFSKHDVPLYIYSNKKLRKNEALQPTTDRDKLNNNSYFVR